MPPPPTPSIKKGDSIKFSAAVGGVGSHSPYPGVVVVVPTDKKPYWVIQTESELIYMSVHTTVSKAL